jgi:hypothetical protein
MNTEKPYNKKRVTVTTLLYNPNYGDNRECECGHSYYRHFDSYEQMDAVGCKYCGCSHFKEKTIKGKAKIDCKFNRLDIDKRERCEYITDQVVYCQGICELFNPK